MDYETFLNSYRIIYEDYTTYIENAISKNVLKGDEIVRDYLSETQVGNYSLKSYKAKIIRNEQEHHQNDQDIIKKSLHEKNELFKLIDLYFDNYQKIDKTKYESPNRSKDLKIILQDLRRERQDLIVQKQTLDKELSSKKKEYETICKNKEKNTKSKIKSFKGDYELKVQELKHITSQSYFDKEQNLLSVDDSKTIKIIKDEIIEIRKKGLLQKKEFELDTCKEIDSELNTYIEETEQIKLDYLTSQNEIQKKLNDIENRLKLIDISISEKGKIYDLEQRRKYIQDYSESLYKLSENLNLHNAYLKKSFPKYTFEDKAFIFDVIINNYNYFLYIALENDELEDLIYYIKEIMTEVRYAKEKFIELYSKNEISSLKKKQDLLKALENYKANDEQQTQEFIDNVITSIERFYDNLYKQIDEYYSEYFKVMMDLCNKIITAYQKVKDITVTMLPTDLFVDYTEYDYGNVSSYGYKKLNNKSMIESGLGNSLEEYYNSKTKNIEKIQKEQIEKAKIKQKALDNSFSLVNKKITYSRNLINKEYKHNAYIIKKNAKKYPLLYKKNISKRKKANKKSTRLRESNANKKYEWALKIL